MKDVEPDTNERVHSKYLAWILNKNEHFLLDTETPSASVIQVTSASLKIALHAQTSISSDVICMIIDAYHCENASATAETTTLITRIEPSIHITAPPAFAQCPTWDCILTEWGASSPAQEFFYGMLGRLVSPIETNLTLKHLFFTILCDDWTGFPLIELFKSCFPSHEVWHHHDGNSSPEFPISGIGIVESSDTVQNIFVEEHRRWFYTTDMAHITSDHIQQITDFETFPVRFKYQTTRYIDWNFPGFAMLEHESRDAFVRNFCFGFRFKHPSTSSYELTSVVMEKLCSELPGVLIRCASTAQTFSRQVYSDDRIRTSVQDIDIRRKHYSHPITRTWFRTRFGHSENVVMPPLCKYVGCTHYQNDCDNEKTHGSCNQGS